MPELPEVETIARGLAQRITGDVIESVWLGQKPEPLKSPADEMAAVLEHTRIAAVHRMGKHIVFDLQREAVARTLSPARSAPPMARGGRSKSGFSFSRVHANNPAWTNSPGPKRA